MTLKSSAKNKKALFIIFFIVVAAGILILIFWPIIFQSDDSQVIQPFMGDNSWITTTTPAGLIFRYPPELLANYISEVNWPPQVTVEDEQFVCNPSGHEIEQGGQTELRTVDSRSYCLTKASEGAAGSIYTTYTYKFPKNNQTGSIVFTLRFVQCQNYDEPKALECENEQAAFDADGLADSIAQSLIMQIND